MRLRKPILISVVLVVVAVIAVGAVLYARGTGVVQPINFKHKIHTPLLGCETCHRYYMERKVAGRPPIEICKSCHPGGGTPEQEKILTYAKRGEEIPWRRVYQLPDHVYFSHARHVTAGKVECETCHGQVKDMNRALSRPLVKIKMDFCISCHKQRETTTDCNACHR